MNAQRKKAEERIYQIFDQVDHTGMNTAYYKTMFAQMSDAEFKKFCERPLCIRFHTKPWVVEPTIDDIIKALNMLGIPLMEKISEGFLYRRKDGEPIWTNYPALVIYVHLKKMKQFLIKKTNITHDIDIRDMKTGQLTSHDKGGRTSDREMEGLVAFNMFDTMDELSTWRADYMDAKNIAYSTIAAKGSVSKEDIPVRNDDSLGKNMMNYYMLGAHLYTNVLNKDYMLPYTIKEKRQRGVTRESE